MKPGIVRALCAGALAGLSACVTTQTPDPTTTPVRFPDAVAFYQPSNVKQTAVFRPTSGDGPYPAVVLAPTCGGVGRHMYDWARRLTNAGYVVLILDSLTPRRVANNCLPAWQATVSINTFNSDVAAAVAHLRTLPYVNPNALGVAGFSFGAIATIKLASQSYRQRIPGGVPGLKAVAFFYGACDTPSSDPLAQDAYAWSTDVDVPIAAFLGAIDNEAPPQPCVDTLERLRARGKDVTYKVYPDTTHSFDESNWGSEGRTIYHGSRGPFLYRYNPEATEDAWRTMHAFFDRVLKGSSS